MVALRLDHGLDAAHSGYNPKHDMKPQETKNTASLDIGDGEADIDSNGCVKAMDTNRMWDLIQNSHGAAVLALVIALRAWRGPGKSLTGCDVGETRLGNWKKLGFTRKGYRVAIKQLEDSGLCRFRATNKGMVGKLLSLELFDIRPETSVTEQVEGPSRGHPEGDNNQDNGPGDHSAGGAAASGLPPSEDEPAPEPAAPDFPDTTGDEEEMTPDQKAAKLAFVLPRCLKVICRLNRIPVFAPDTLQAAIEYFERNINYQWYDVALICLLGIRASRETPVPEGLDPYYQCRRFAHLPNKMFDSSLENDLHLALMQNELGYNAGLPENHDDFLLVLNQEYQRVGAPLDPRTKLRTNLE